MRYSQDTIEEVRSRNDIVDVVGAYVPLTKKSGRYWGLCPFHGEKTSSFSVNPQRQMYYCFGCHKSGNAITFLMEYEGLTFVEAVKSLASRVGIELPEADVSEEEKKKSSLKARILEVNKLAAGYFYKSAKTERGSRAIEYFKKRGLTDETIVHWGLGYSNPYSDDLYKYLKSKGYEDSFLKETGLVTFSEKGVTDKFWNRAMFPIMDERDRVIAFGGRVMGDGEPKYLNSPETMVFDKSNNLYGLNYAKQSREGYFLLCEGYMDVIALHQAGFTNAVASLGTAFTDKHCLKISKYVKEVRLTYDSDGAGVNAALRAIPMLEARGITVRVINMRPYKDPDEFIKALGADEYRKRIDESESSFFFEIGVMASRFRLDDPKEKSDFYKSVTRRLLQIPGELERKTYEEAFVKRYNIEFKPFDDMLVETARTEGTTARNSYENVATPPPRVRFENAKEKRWDEKALQPQRLLLTYLADEPSLFPKISKVLSPEEFIGDTFVKVATLAYASCRENGDVNAAKIINQFEEKEDQEIVGTIFQTELPGEVNEAERIKAISDTIRKIKMNKLDEEMNRAGQEGNDAETLALLSKYTALKNGKTNLI